MDCKELLIELINNITDEKAIEYIYRDCVDFVILHDSCSIRQKPLQSEQEYHVESA